MYKRSKGFASLGIIVLAVAVLGLGFLATNFDSFKGDIKSSANETIKKNVTYSLSNAGNEDGNSFSSSSLWLGTGQSTSNSYLGVKFSGESIPKGAVITSAKIDFVSQSTQWLTVGGTFYAEKTASPQDFSTASKPSQRSLTSANNTYSDNVKWEGGKTYSYDVTKSIAEVVVGNSVNTIVIISKGSNQQWGRKFIQSSGSNAPKLQISYTYTQTGTNPNPTPIVVVPTQRPSATPRASVIGVIPTRSPSPRATATSRPVQTMPPMTMAPRDPGTGGGGISNNGNILGLVTADVLGTCSAAVHDKYVVTGADGAVYRTWHPQKDSSGCTFAHEHGDNPSTSAIYAGKLVAFGYAAFKMDAPKDEPHVGFKCFVHNKGMRNDEGTVALHDSYYCFHMGTGGASRFTARFHSMEFHARTSTGALMRVNGMADVGNVGTICSSPRQQRTVQGLGCKIDSGYEIWENALRISNKGNTVALATTSTAVFDPITSMDPADPARTLYSWSPEAMAQIYKFNNDNSGNRGCDREAYSGPLNWYNQGGSQVYYTDAYGNVVNGGPLKQEISTVGMNGVGTLTQFGGLIMGYKGSEPQSQFKFKRSYCGSGLGLKN